MHKGVNATNIVLIPKVQNPKRTNHFWPISLCNVMYKVISKIIVNRIKPILPKLIYPTQAAFVPGRNIQDNNVLVQEIIHSFNRKRGKEGFFAIKIDLMKAYDKLSWGAINQVLSCFGIPMKFRNWISQCVSTTTLSICLNGGQVGTINPSCDLRQGDPLSPYLFIWTAEILSRLLNCALDKNNIKGIRLSRGGPILSHIFFADDLILVGRANVDEVRGYWQCLESFCSWFGQQVNKLKTSIFFSKNTPRGLRQEIKDMLAGRATLIKSVGLSMPMYAMQNTKLSNRMASRIDSMVRDFWWGFEKDNHGLYLKAWDKLCLPKSLGGLGFRKTREMNRAFLAKWGWNILNGSQSLCCRVLTAKYLRGKEFLNCASKSSDSWFGKNVIKSRTILEKGACKIVADGRETRIWEDPWIPHLKDFKPKPRTSNTGVHTFVADLISSDGRWDVHKHNSLFDRVTVLAILRGGIPSGLGQESGFGHLKRMGISPANLLISLSRWRELPNVFWLLPFWNKLWNSKVLERHKVLWLCILSNALPLRSVINKRFHIEEVRCPLCGREEETVEHLFLTCDIALHVWLSSPWDLRATIFPVPAPCLEQCWSPPPQGWIKLNCDVRVGLDSMCLAAMARNHLGEVVKVHTACWISLMRFVGKRRLAVWPSLQP
uniref:Reverse transcriptase domain-containing protein n=1 Tax=Cannabis sativa TaxID=3483 RepID=A0A803NHF6_CANSA